jgi:hypothetical protein
MECFDAEHSGIEVGVGFEEFLEHAAMNIVATRERDMRVPGTQVGFESDGEGDVLHSFVQLKEMRVPLADTDPDDLHRTFRWERPDPGDGQKESPKLNLVEFLPQSPFDILRDVRKETKREVHLIPFGPTRAGNVRVKIDKHLFDGCGQIDGDEETLHCDELISAPGRA